MQQLQHAHEHKYLIQQHIFASSHTPDSLGCIFENDSFGKTRRDSFVFFERLNSARLRLPNNTNIERELTSKFAISASQKQAHATWMPFVHLGQLRSVLAEADFLSTAAPNGREWYHSREDRAFLGSGRMALGDCSESKPPRESHSFRRGNSIVILGKYQNYWDISPLTWAFGKLAI